MTHRAFSIVLLAGVICNSPKALRAQDAGPVIRTESREVLVDAVAVDKKGKFARDLTAKNFRVWEDGREQKISAFSLESSGVTPERPSKHYIAMFFDTSGPGQSDEMAARREGARFVEGFATPDRYMAVIDYNLNGGTRISQNFTTDRELLRKALGQAPSVAGTAPVPDNPGAALRGAASPPPDNASAREVLDSLRSLMNSLAAIRGRKALVFFSSGMAAGQDLSRDLEATIKAANKANVAVYSVAAPTGGGANLNIAEQSAPPAGRGARAPNPLAFGTNDLNIANSLAQGTGGVIFTTTTNLAESLGKVAQEQDEYYLLAYTPVLDSAEGSCHELRVKVDRSDLELRARKGYCTSKPVDPLSGKPVGKALETRAAGTAAGNMAAAMQLPWFYSAPNVARVNLAMEINPASMKFHRDKGKLHAEIVLAGVAYKAAGTAAARVSDVVKLDFDTQLQADAFLKTPYHYENQFEIAPGQYSFRMAFSSDTSGAHAFGKVELPLSIDPWDGHALSMSGLALSRDAHPAADVAAGLDVSLLEGMRPLVAGGFEVVPSGGNQFRMDEKMFVYLEAYEPLLAGAKQESLPLVGLRIRVIDAGSGQQKADTGAKIVASFMRAGNPVVPIVSAIPTANLSAGAYTVEVSVMRQTGAPLVRTADFNIR